MVKKKVVLDDILNRMRQGVKILRMEAAVVKGKCNAY